MNAAFDMHDVFQDFRDRPDVIGGFEIPLCRDSPLTDSSMKAARDREVARGRGDLFRGQSGVCKMVDEVLFTVPPWKRVQVELGNAGG